MKAWQDPIGTIRDVCQSDPAESYHPDIAKLYSTDVPDGTVNGATLIGTEWTNPAPPPAPIPPTSEEIAAVTESTLINIKDTSVKEIDSAVIAIYERPMVFSKEYEARELAANEYKAAGYIGEVPPRLLGFSTPSGLTPKVAADLILTQAAGMRSALDSLSDLRMRKYEVLRAGTDTEARSVHTEIMSAIAAIAKSLD